jgi:hypothetical protein
MYCAPTEMTLFTLKLRVLCGSKKFRRIYAGLLFAFDNPQRLRYIQLKNIEC